MRQESEHDKTRVENMMLYSLVVILILTIIGINIVARQTSYFGNTNISEDDTLNAVVTTTSKAQAFMEASSITFNTLKIYFYIALFFALILIIYERIRLSKRREEFRENRRRSKALVEDYRRRIGVHPDQQQTP